jgi:hypothetical protein
MGRDDIGERSRLEFHPPLEGGSKFFFERMREEEFRGGVMSKSAEALKSPLPEICFAPKALANFDPPSRGGWKPIP